MRYSGTPRDLVRASLSVVAIACALLTGCDARVSESGTTEQRTSLGEIRRVDNYMVDIDLARGVSLGAVLDMSLFAKTTPEMPYDAARAALGEPIASRVDSYNVTWHRFIIPSGHAEVGREKAGSDDLDKPGSGEVGIVGWRLYVYPNTERAPLARVLTEQLRPYVRSLRPTRAEIFINSRDEVQQVSLEVKDERITRASWIRHKTRE